jgi:two-component system, OmpR family, KDP operon response regulator KdpE
MKVLVIDDDPAMTELLCLLLKPAASSVLVANTGLDGLNLVREQNPDIIVLDLMMPEMDGYEVCQEIRSFSRTPILILSALDMPGMVSKALDAGADDYLIKPVTSSILIAHINNLLKRVNNPVQISPAE